MRASPWRETIPSWALEASLWALGYSAVAGVDEAGRGALAGPVVAAAVLLPYGDYPYNDSKQLSPKRRAIYAEEIKARALFYGIGMASPQEIDRLNVLAATHLAAMRALAAFPPHIALVTDYLKLPHYPLLAPARADSLSIQVAAASILAKTTRDALMVGLEADYPHYGFAQHKGYGSPEHLRALAQYGPSPLHRFSFKPVMQGRLFSTER